MSAYPTAFPATHEAWETMEVPTDRPGFTKTLTRVDMGLARSWVEKPQGLIINDPTADSIKEQEELLGAEKVAQMLWLYKEEFMKTSHDLLTQVDTTRRCWGQPIGVGLFGLKKTKKNVKEYKQKIKKIICIGKIHLAKSQKLWKMDAFARGIFADPLYKEALQQHIKMYEHIEKSYRFALAGNRVKATKYAEKIQGDMDDIWMNMTELSEKSLEIKFAKNEAVKGKDGIYYDKATKSIGDWAQKGILEHIVEERKDCLEMIEHLC